MRDFNELSSDLKKLEHHYSILSEEKVTSFSIDSSHVYRHHSFPSSETNQSSEIETKST